MYRKKGRGWTKHIDFMLLDVLCMQIAFIVSYIWRFGLGNPYIDKDYRILAVAFLLIDFFVEIVSDAFKNVLKRGYLDEFIVTCKHGENVKIYDHNHRTDATKGPFRKQGYVIGRVEIGSNVWIGSDVLILPNIRIGDNVIIAAGAIVTKDIPDNVTYIQKRNSVEVPNGK